MKKLSLQALDLDALDHVSGGSAHSLFDLMHLGPQQAAFIGGLGHVAAPTAPSFQGFSSAGNVTHVDASGGVEISWSGNGAHVISSHTEF